MLNAPSLARTLRSSTNSPIAVAGLGVESLRDEKIPKGMFLMEKWLPLGTEMYDIVLENTRIENVRRMMMCSGLSVFIQELWSSGDRHVIRLGSGCALIVRSNLSI